MNYHTALERYIQTADILNHIVFNDVGIAVFDREQCWVYVAGKTLDLKAKMGDSIRTGSAVHRAMEEKRRIVMKVDKSVYGVPYIAVAVPIPDERGQIIGGVVVTQPTNQQDQLKEMATALGDSISLLASTTEEISAQTEEITAVSQTVAKVAQESSKRARETDKVIGLIKGLARQTNLLGLNASIEAARVGDQGRGFGVVAEEIRKLASSSASSIEQINNILKIIQTDSENTFQQIEKIERVITEIAQATAGVAEAVQGISRMAIDLDTVADSLSREY